MRGCFRLARRLDSFRIARSVIVDLETEELVDCLKRILVWGRDANSTTCRRRLKCVGYCASLRFHHGNPRRQSVMNEHGHLEVALREHLSDVGQMHSYLVPSDPVVLIFRVHFDCATICEEKEMVG